LFFAYNVTFHTFYEYQKPCSSCGAIPKNSKIFNRHSPNTEVVTQHLKAAGHEITITPTDCLRIGCYKMHSTIMETYKSTGTDDMLKHDIEKWVNKYNEPNTNNVITAILAAVIYVAN